jgi:DUF971 family protein
MKPRPSRIALSSAHGLLIIDWEDGRQCKLSLPKLRAACPCAECRGVDTDSDVAQESHLNSLEVPLYSTQAIQLDDLERVGNYALRLVWKDGHQYGIYAWDYLSELCASSVQSVG